MEVVGEDLLVLVLTENTTTNLISLIANRLAGRPRTGHVLQRLTHPRLREPLGSLLLAVQRNHLRVLRRRDILPWLPRRPPETTTVSGTTSTAQNFLAGFRQVTGRIQVVGEPRQRRSRQLLVRQPAGVIPPLQQLLMELRALRPQPSKRIRQLGVQHTLHKCGPIRSPHQILARNAELLRLLHDPHSASTLLRDTSSLRSHPVPQRRPTRRTQKLPLERPRLHRSIVRDLFHVDPSQRIIRIVRQLHGPNRGTRIQRSVKPLSGLVLRRQTKRIPWQWCYRLHQRRRPRQRERQRDW